MASPVPTPGPGPLTRVARPRNPHSPRDATPRNYICGTPIRGQRVPVKGICFRKKNGEALKRTPLLTQEMGEHTTCLFVKTTVQTAQPITAQQVTREVADTSQSGSASSERRTGNPFGARRATWWCVAEGDCASHTPQRVPLRRMVTKNAQKPLSSSLSSICASPAFRSLGGRLYLPVPPAAPVQQTSFPW